MGELLYVLYIGQPGVLKIYLKGLCHGFYQIFEQPKFIFVLQET